MPGTPPGLRALLDGARSLRLEGRPDEAEAAVRDALARFPDEPMAHLAMAKYLIPTDPEAAIEHVEAAVEIAPGDPPTLTVAALLMFALDLDRSAELVEAIADVPNHDFEHADIALWLRGAFALVREDDEDAEHLLRGALEINPGGHAAELLGRFLLDRERLYEALEVVRRALARRPGEADLAAMLDEIARALSGGPETETPKRRAGATSATGGRTARTRWPLRHTLPGGDVLVLHGRGPTGEWRVTVEGTDRVAWGRPLPAVVAELLDLGDEPWPEWLVDLAAGLGG